MNKENIMETAYLSKELDSELRNDLAGILGNAQFLEESPLNATQKQFVKDILYSSYNLLKAIEQIEHLSTESQRNDSVIRNYKI